MEKPSSYSVFDYGALSTQDNPTTMRVPVFVVRKGTVSVWLKYRLLTSQNNNVTSIFQTG